MSSYRERMFWSDVFQYSSPYNIISQFKPMHWNSYLYNSISWGYVTLVGRLQKCFFLFLLRFYLFIFRERWKEGEREGEKQQCVVASCVRPTRFWPATQAWALTGNQTRDLLVLRTVFNPLRGISHRVVNCHFLYSSVYPVFRAAICLVSLILWGI